jgi:hypothetical protein
MKNNHSICHPPGVMLVGGDAGFPARRAAHQHPMNKQKAKRKVQL